MLLTTLLLLAQTPEASTAVETLSQDPAEIPRYAKIYEIASLLEDPWSAVSTPGKEADAGGRSLLEGAFWDWEVAMSETWNGSGDPAHPYATAEELMRSLRAFAWPALDSRFETLKLDKGYLTAHLRKDQHEWVQTFLDSLRSGTYWQARVDARFVRLPRGGAAKLGLERSSTSLSGKEASDAFLAKLERTPHEILASPSLIVGPAQRARMSILNQVAYVKDVELKVVQPGNVEIADPVVAVVHEGKILDLRVLDVGGGIYGMEMKSTVAQLERPIKTHKLRLGPQEGMEVEIGTPEVITAGIDAELRMASGDSVVLFSPSAGDFDLLVVVSFQIVTLPHVLSLPPDVEGED